MYVANSGKPFDSARSTPPISTDIEGPSYGPERRTMADETEPAMFDALEKSLMPLNSARQLAELSGIGESTLAEWRGTHTGPAYVKSGRRVLYPKEAVLGFMRANLRECKEASA